MRRLLYIIGAPGAGKSTLMARLTAPLGARAVAMDMGYPAPPREWLIDETMKIAAVELGRRRGQFSGTDALASSIINVAEPWLTYQRESETVYAEGARLGNARFLKAAVDAGYKTVLIHLDHAQVDDWRKARSEIIGREQNPSWVAGRATACRNLAVNPPLGVSVIRGHPDAVYTALNEGLDSL